MATRSLAISILLAGAAAAEAAPARAPTTAETLERAAEAIDATLREADAAVAGAAKTLGSTGLEGAEARERLEALCGELSYAVICSAADATGRLVEVTPAAFGGFVGSDVGEQSHMKRLRRTEQPVLSDAFRAVEGFDTIHLAYPVYDERGRLLGSAGALIRPASLVGHAVKPVLPEDAPEVVVFQQDGYVLYADPEEIGRNLFTDPMYQPYPDLQELARYAVSTETGSGTYHFRGRGLTPPVEKRARWTTAGLHGTEWRVMATEAAEPTGAPVARYAAPELPVSADIGLASLVALSDGHLQDIAEDFALVAAEAEGAAGWDRFRERLRRVSEVNVEAAWWYARADGTYWTLDGGRARGGLAERPYFARVLAGETVVGDLVVSRSTGRNVAIVAVPVVGSDGRVTGVLGASVYLDRLSARLRSEMGLPEDVLIYAFDADERVALHGDREKVFVRADEFGPEIARAFDEMQRNEQGTISYTYEDRRRHLVYRRSPVTGWWYAFGPLGELEPRG